MLAGYSTHVDHLNVDPFLINIYIKRICKQIKCIANSIPMEYHMRIFVPQTITYILSLLIKTISNGFLYKSVCDWSLCSDEQIHSDRTF
jgi:hypothetical protein